MKRKQLRRTGELKLSSAAALHKRGRHRSPKSAVLDVAVLMEFSTLQG